MSRNLRPRSGLDLTARQSLGSTPKIGQESAAKTRKTRAASKTPSNKSAVENVEPLAKTPKIEPTKKGAAAGKKLENKFSKVDTTAAKNVDGQEEIVDDVVQVDEKSLRDLLECFNLTEMPDALPCRDTEVGEIRRFIEANLNSGTSGCAYISGVPGTGKTASVRLVMKELQKQKQHLPSFVFVELNGLLISDSKRIYVEFYKALSNTKKFFLDSKRTDRISPVAAKNALDRLFEFTDESRPSIILLLDEIDGLMTKRQQHLYQLFQWPNQEGSKLTVLAIANTLDFPERFSNRVQSRMGLQRLCFKPYDHKQIKEILLSRLQKKPECVDQDATEYIARKVASVSGDIRRAFEICRIAIDIVLSELDSTGDHEPTTQGKRRKTRQRLCGPLKQEHADQALKKLLLNVKVQAIKSASTHEKLLLEAAVTEYGRVGQDEIPFNRMWHHYQILCQEKEIEQLTVDGLLDVTNRLAGCNLLRRVTPSSAIGQDFTARYRLNVNPGDVKLALAKV